MLDFVSPRDSPTFTTVYDNDAAASLTIFNRGPNVLVFSEDRDHPAHLSILGEVLNNGQISGGGELDAGGIENGGFIQATSARWNLVINAESLENSGTMLAHKGATLLVDGNVTNNAGGILEASGLSGGPSQFIVDGSLNNSGIVRSDIGSRLSVSGNVINSGDMLTDRHSILNFAGVTNVKGGHLVAYDNSTIYIGGPAIGGNVDLFSHAAVDLNGGASTMNVRFLGGLDEQLTLGQSASYHGSLSILTGRGDTADLFDIRFSPVMTRIILLLGH